MVRVVAQQKVCLCVIINDLYLLCTLWYLCILRLVWKILIKKEKIQKKIIKNQVKEVTAFHAPHKQLSVYCFRIFLLFMKMTDNVLSACRGDVPVLNNCVLQLVKETSLPLIPIPPK